MSGSLVHSPADVLRHLLIDLGVGTLPTAVGAWPIGVSRETDNPDNMITVYDTSGILQGRTHTDGRQLEQYGLQFRIRSVDFPTGYTKANALIIVLDETINLDNVVISSSTYQVQSVSRRGGIVSIGSDTPTSKREVFTVNAICSLNQTS